MSLLDDNCNLSNVNTRSEARGITKPFFSLSRQFMLLLQYTVSH